MKYIFILIVSILLLSGVSCEKRIIPLKTTVYGKLDEIPVFSVPDSVLQGTTSRLTDSYGNTTYYLYYNVDFTHPLYHKDVVVYGKTKDGINYDGIQRIEVDSIRLH
jgi:hypothetical protein